MAEFERLGGAVAAIEQGVYQQLIADEAYRKEQRIASGEDVVVGVNAFVDDTAVEPERFDVPPHLESEQREKLVRLRERRDGAAVAARLAALEEAARGQDNLMPRDPRRRACRCDAGRGLRGAADGVRRVPAGRRRAHLTWTNRSVVTDEPAAVVQTAMPPRCLRLGSTVPGNIPMMPGVST